MVGGASDRHCRPGRHPRREGAALRRRGQDARRSADASVGTTQASDPGCGTDLDSSATLFGLLDALPLRTTSQDTSVEEALRFLQAHSSRTGEWLLTTRTERIGPNQTAQIPLLDLSWVPEGWWRLLTDESRRDQFPD